jgi:hypothetical protein
VREPILRDSGPAPTTDLNVVLNTYGFNVAPWVDSHENEGEPTMVDVLASEVWERMKRRMLDQVDSGRGDWIYPDDVFETILAGESTREVVEWAVRETVEAMEDHSKHGES